MGVRYAAVVPESVHSLVTDIALARAYDIKLTGLEDLDGLWPQVVAEMQ